MLTSATDFGKKERAGKRKEFYQNVRLYFEEVCAYLVDKLPWDDPVLQSVSVLDPAPEKRMETTHIRSIMDLCQRWPCLVTSSVDKIIEQFISYQVEGLAPKKV